MEEEHWVCTGNTPLLPLIPNNHGCNGLYAPPLFWFLGYEQALISSSLWPRKSAHLKGLREMLRHIKRCWVSRKNLSANLSFSNGSSSIITWRSVNKIVKPWIQVYNMCLLWLGRPYPSDPHSKRRVLLIFLLQSLLPPGTAFLLSCQGHPQTVGLCYKMSRLRILLCTIFVFSFWFEFWLV